MFWFYVVLFFLGLFLLGIFLSLAEIDYEGITMISSAVFGCIFLITCFIGYAIQYSAQFDLRKAQELLPVKMEQRDDLVKLVRGELSSEEYQAMMSMTDPAQVVLIFKDNGVSQILITRVTTIVSLNQYIFDLENDIISQKIDICNDQQNVFIPRFPWLTLPECEYNFDSTK